MACSFVKCGYSIGIFLNSGKPICRSTDISKCFRGSLQLRDNKSQLYLNVPPFWGSVAYKLKNQTAKLCGVIMSTRSHLEDA